MSATISEPLTSLSETSIKIKQEKLTPPPSPESVPSTTTENPTEAAIDDKKAVTPVKSSNQLLDELFQAFSAVVPESLLCSIPSTSEVARKKHKKEKKSKKSKHKERLGDDTDIKQPVKEEHRKRVKVKREKRSKNDKPDKNDKVHKSSSDAKTIEPKTDEIKVKVEKRRIGYPDDGEDQQRRHKRVKLERSRSKERSSKSDHPIERDKGRILLSSSYSKPKIVIKNLKDSTVIQDAEVKSKKSSSRRHHHNHDRGHRDEHGSDNSAFSLSDEETYQLEKNSYFEHDRREDRRDRHRGHSRDRSRRSSDRQHHERSDHRRSDRGENRFYASRERRSSNDREVIDKRRLLEVARKNAIRMLENGTLPGTQNISTEAKKMVLEKMRFGGKSVDELTDFCKKLANGNGGSGYLSNQQESDEDNEHNEKAFNHPFVLKDRGPIVMNIRNSVPLPTKTADQTKALLMQFPVSSGQHHRLNESEWVPVVKQKKIEAITPAPAKSTITTTPIVQPPLPPHPTSTTDEENAQQLLPNSSKPPLAVHNAQKNLAQYQNQTTASSLNAPLHQPPISHQGSLTQDTQPTAHSAEQPDAAESNIFIGSQQADNLDVTSIISQRLNALRKLQNNPHDSEALKLMYNAQKDMSSWANSKYVPGQFTGSTGANILSARELTSGYQAWAKKDQLMVTTPVSGGMGMHLLQKMGWRPGEGLGKDKTGQLQPLLLEVKLDKKGLLAHEEDPNVIRKQKQQQLHQQQQQQQQQQRLQQKQQQIQQQQQFQQQQQYQNPQSNGNNNNQSLVLDSGSMMLEGKHPVSHLGELAAKRKWIQPMYSEVEDSGPPHQKQFLFTVNVNGMNYTPVNMSNTKKEAKSVAAKFALQQMGFIN